MNLRAIDLNLLPVFEAVYIERNLTRASEVLHVTQPAVSNALSRLRVSLNDALFVRAGRGVLPTPAAQSLIGPVREALAKLRTSLDPQASFSPSTSERVFNIAVRDTAASAIVPMLANRLERAAPDVRIHCHLVERREIPAELATGRLDFAIDIPSLARPELDSVSLMSDRLVCILRRNHPACTGKLTLRRFLGLRHIAVSSRRSGRTLIDEALSRVGEKLRPVMRLPHYQPAFHCVMSSDHALVAPASLAPRYEVAVRELPLAAISLDLLLFWRREATEDPASRWMRAEVAAAACAAAADHRAAKSPKRR
jgi:DNA-binding transcriptional LysR family regulator